MNKRTPKPKLGRPSMGPNARRVPIMVKATEIERAVWEKKAKTEGMSLAAWLAKPRRDEMDRNK